MRACPQAATTVPPNAKTTSPKSATLPNRAPNGHAKPATTTRAAVGSATGAAARPRPTTGGAGMGAGTTVGREGVAGMRMRGGSMGGGVAMRWGSRMGARTEDVTGTVATIMAPVMGRVERSTETHPVKKKEEIMPLAGTKAAANTTRSTDPLLYIFIYSLY